MSFFTGFMTGAANEAVEIQKENKSRREEMVDKAMERFYQFTLPEQRKYADRQRKVGGTIKGLVAAGYSEAEARSYVNVFGEDATVAQIIQNAKPPRQRTTATEGATAPDQTTAALGEAVGGATEPSMPTTEAGMPTTDVTTKTPAPTDTQTASTTPAGGFDLGRVLFDQNSPERTTGAILAALSAETGLKPEQIDAYLRGEFGPDAMSGETAPIEIDPIGARDRFAAQEARDLMGLERENRLELEEFKQRHDIRQAEIAHARAVQLLETELAAKAQEGGLKPSDIRSLAKDSVSAVAGTGLYSEFTSMPDGANGTIIVWSAEDPSINEQARVHSAMASNEAVFRLQSQQPGQTSVTAADVAEKTSAVIVTARNAAGYITEGTKNGSASSPEYYTSAATEAVGRIQNPEVVSTAMDMMYTAWLNAAKDPDVRAAIDASRSSVMAALRGENG